MIGECMVSIGIQLLIVVSMHLVDKLVSNLLYQTNIDIQHGEYQKVRVWLQFHGERELLHMNMPLIPRHTTLKIVCSMGVIFLDDSTA